MPRRRSVIDYALARRAALTALRSGATTLTDVCDADPYLLRAARFHGEPTGRWCPVCDRQRLLEVIYAYGDELGQYSGRIRSRAEIRAMETTTGDVRVFVVEVCRGCQWNHLTTSFVIGDGRSRRPPRRQSTAEDDYPG